MKTNLICLLLMATVFVTACTKENITQPIAAKENAESAIAAFSIGQAYGGGIIYFIDSTGQHGLIAATQDIGGTFPVYKTWSNGSGIVTHATAIGVYKGSLNTDKIIYFQGNGDYAAADCRAYNGGGYTDWYLPSKRETVLLRKNGGAAGLTLSSNGYFTSTEVDANTAYCVSVGPYIFALDKSIPASVRAIRAF
ncbi:DUF1566 domain-containing protein [Panacibacter ginsenosidivorans]|uniref:DUF1566 domain-containing protein n=1 Tax=Panacibacter ginsenosidivorans TaxID=1813871 RepID=A0A5B8VG33_9BACT|nr:DUF1566 domain-containing protein [Panacibacter ginsenosidivorans]QEC69995.1 DUF1566 domain-containing protein [Panacibacter ginsenosidivorans]